MSGYETERKTKYHKKFIASKENKKINKSEKNARLNIVVIKKKWKTIKKINKKKKKKINKQKYAIIIE